jgi:hypothetical protein
MHGSRTKIISKNLNKQRFGEGFNSGVKGLMNHPQSNNNHVDMVR